MPFERLLSKPRRLPSAQSTGRVCALEEPSWKSKKRWPNFAHNLILPLLSSPKGPANNPSTPPPPTTSRMQAKAGSAATKQAMQPRRHESKDKGPLGHMNAGIHGMESRLLTSHHATHITSIYALSTVSDLILSVESRICRVKQDVPLEHRALKRAGPHKGHHTAKLDNRLTTDPTGQCANGRALGHFSNCISWSTYLNVVMALIGPLRLPHLKFLFVCLLLWHIMEPRLAPYGRPL